MLNKKRPAAGAAAMLMAIIGTFHAAPSRAWEMTTQPIAAATSEPDSDSDTTLLTMQHEASLPAPAAPEAEAPPPPARRTLAQLVEDYASSATLGAQHDCLAGAVYFEAKGEPLRGQLSVAEVILNRARSGRFPTTACGVVKQRGQFSFVRGGRLPAIPRASAAWRKAVAVARVALEDRADGAAPKALFFHARSVSPGWRGLTRVAAVGNHVFYR
jgi:N-acetylmuramoyl-L-alanine amidase